MKAKRIITMALAISMLASATVLTGCKKEEKVNGETPTITYWSEFSGVMETGAQSFADLPCMQELMKRTGVNIEYIHPSSTDYAEQFNLMVASGEYPDVIEYGIYSYPGGPQAAIDDNVIIPLNDVFEKYCPNLTKYLKENPEVEKAIKTDNGQYFCFPAVYNDDYLQVYSGLIARKDLLDQLGMQNPETIDEWTEMLRGFKSLGIESPFISTPGNLYAITQAFGINAGRYVEDGEIKYGVLQPEYKDAVKLLNSWYQEGLLEPNLATVDNNMVKQNMISGTSAVGYGNTGGGIGTWMNANKDNPSYNLTALKYPVLKKGDTPFFGQREHAAALSLTASISTQCDDIEAAAKVLDYAYSEEGLLLFNFGIEGESYEMIDGYPTYTEKVTNNENGADMSTMIQYYARPNGIGPSIRDRRYMEQFAALPQQKESIEVWSQTEAKDHMLPQVTLTAEEREQISTKQTDITSYVNQMFLKYVTGVEDMSSFDGFVAKVKEMGAEEINSVYQNAYDRYMAR